MRLLRKFFVFCVLNLPILVEASTFTVPAVVPAIPAMEGAKKSENVKPLRLPSLAPQDDDVMSPGAPKKPTKTEKMKVLINLAMQKEEASFTKLFGKLSDEDKKLFATEKFRIPSLNLKGWSLLHVASKNGNLGIVKSLVEAGADPSVRTDDNLTPIDYAKANGHVPVVNYLNTLGGKKSTHDHKEDLKYAVAHGDLTTAQKLMDQYPYTKHDIEMAVETAKFYGHPEIVDQLKAIDPVARFQPERERRRVARLAPVDPEEHRQALQRLDHNENLDSLPNLLNRSLVRHRAVAPLQHSSALKYMAKEDGRLPQESSSHMRLVPLEGEF